MEKIVARRRLTWTAAAASVLVLLLTAGGSAAQTPHSQTPLVLSIEQSNYTTEQGSFTVSLEVSSSANIQFVYFTFCQLSSPLCYLPVSMSLQGSNWYVGTTHPMTSYNGMTVGVRAGYNITIEFDNDTNVTEPSIPNAFSGLTIAQSVTGEYMFQMTVRNQLYGLSGIVTDSVTGAALAGATVSLTPGDNSTTTSASGAYAFANLTNGSYTLAVTDKGYTSASETVTVSGSSTVKNVAITNSSEVGKPGGSKTSSGSPITLTETALIVVVVLVVAAVVGVIAIRRKRKPEPTPAPVESSEARR